MNKDLLEEKTREASLWRDTKSLFSLYVFITETLEEHMDYASSSFIALDYIHTVLVTRNIGQEDCEDLLLRRIHQYQYSLGTQSYQNKGHEFIRDPTDKVPKVIDIFSKIEYEEILQCSFEHFSLRERSLILHLILYPNDISLLYRTLFLSSYEKYTVLDTVFKLLGEHMLFHDDAKTQYPALFPKTYTEKAQLLAQLERNSPDILVLLLLLQSPTSLLQFLLIFGGSTLKIPTLDKFHKLLDNYVSEQQTGSQKYISSLLDNDSETFQTSLADFVEKSYNILLGHYESFLKDLTSRVDINNPQTFLDVYHFFYAEMQAQLALVKNSATAVSGIEEIKRVVQNNKNVKKSKKKGKIC